MNFIDSPAWNFSTGLWVDFLRLFIVVCWLILALRVIWRVEKKLDAFFKLLTLAGCVIAIREIIKIFNHLGVIEVGLWVVLLDLLQTIFVFAAMVVMNKIITRLDGE